MEQNIINPRGGRPDGPTAIVDRDQVPPATVSTRRGRHDGYPFNNASLAEHTLEKNMDETDEVLLKQDVKFAGM